MSSKVDGHTHGVGCYGWHRGHYQCALDEIKRLNDALSSAWDSLNELRGDAKEAEERAFQALDRPAPETGPVETLRQSVDRVRAELKAAGQEPTCDHETMRY